MTVHDIVEERRTKGFAWVWHRADFTELGVTMSVSRSPKRLDRPSRRVFAEHAKELRDYTHAASAQLVAPTHYGEVGAMLRKEVAGELAYVADDGRSVMEAPRATEPPRQNVVASGMKRMSLLLKQPMLAMGLLVALAQVRCEGEDAAQCEDWSRQASIGRRAARDDAGRGCSADADCQIVDYGLRCFADCGYPSAVASSALPVLEAEIRKIDKDNCDRFEAANCSGPIAPPCVPPLGSPAAVCRGGQCTLEITPYR